MAGDFLWSNAKLALRCTGTNNSTAFPDISPKLNTLTANGNAKVVTTQTGPFGDSNGVMYLDGTGDYLTLPATNLHTGSSDFCVRSWVRLSELKNQVLFVVGESVATREFEVDIGSTGLIFVYAQTGPGTYSSTSTTTNPLSINTWYFLEWSRVGNTVYLFVNGTLIISSAYNYTNQTAASLAYLGRIEWATTWDFHGYVYDFQVIIGAGGHTANYTVPTAPFITYQSQISGTITESLVANTFIARAYDVATGALVGEKKFTGTSAFTINITTAAAACEVKVSADYEIWKASSVYALGDKAFPTDPVATPYYYKRIAAGTSGGTEPAWPTTAGGQCNDGAVANAWELVERLIQPITHGPLIPS